MAGRLGLAPASRPNMLGVLAAAGLVVALVFTGRSLDAGSERRPPLHPALAGATDTYAPYRISGRIECPRLWPVLAMTDHSSYPPGHPAKPPPAATAVACYQTTVQAASAGYAPAALPAGALEVSGVYLIPTSRGFRARCQQVADRLGFAVPCPGLLPAAPPGLPPPRLCEESSMCRPGQVLLFTQGGFEVPPGYVGPPNTRYYGELGIVATPARGATGRLHLGCPNERPIATPTVHRAWTVLVACPEASQVSIFGRSVLLRWSRQGTLVVVRLGGWSDVNQRLVVALADHLRLVGPTT
jgi:hypothetical protein